MKKILHLITSLEGGGTENFLYQVVANSPPGFEHQVVFLKKDGVIGERIRRKQVTVLYAGGPLALFRILRREKPDILHTCLYRAHILGRVIGKLAGVPAIITSQRAIDIGQKPWQRKLDAWTQPMSRVVIVNSHAAAEMIARRRGNEPVPEIVEIPNGVDATVFKSSDRAAARKRYGLPSDAIVGGALMRLHPEKGADLIPLFAAALLSGAPQAHLLIGGVGPLEPSIKEALSRNEIRDRIHWVGWEENTPQFLSACDFFWSLSREESFPQTLVEASVMGLPWVAPNVGGVEELIKKGAVGRPFRRLDMADAARQSADLIAHLSALTAEARAAAERISSIYSLKQMVSRVYEVFATIAPESEI